MPRFPQKHALEPPKHTQEHPRGTPGSTLQKHDFEIWERVKSVWRRKLEDTHRGARTHDHKVKSLALYRLS